MHSNRSPESTHRSLTLWFLHLPQARLEPRRPGTDRSTRSTLLGGRPTLNYARPPGAQGDPYTTLSDITYQITIHPHTGYAAAIVWQRFDVEISSSILSHVIYIVTILSVDKTWRWPWMAKTCCSSGFKNIHALNIQSCVWLYTLYLVIHTMVMTHFKVTANWKSGKWEKIQVVEKKWETGVPVTA